MSELYDDDPIDLPPIRSQRRILWLVGGAVTLLLLFFALTTFATLWTDKLWFDSVGSVKGHVFGHVYTRLFWTKTGLFLAAATVMGGSLAVSMFLAFRERPFYGLLDDQHHGMARYRDAIEPVRRWILIGVSGLVGVFGGVSGASAWRTFLLWADRTPFHQQDPYFHKDDGFYVFTLPWWHYLLDFAMTTVLLCLIATLLVHYLYGAVRLSGDGERFTRPAQVQVGVLAGLLALLKGVDYWLDRYDIVHAGGSLFTGIGWTDEHAVLPGKEILAVSSLVVAVLFFVAAWRHRWLLPNVGLGLLLICSVVLGLIWPAIVQGFEVKPSQVKKETSYAADNIAATRAAYGLDGVQTVTYQDDSATANPTKAALIQAAAQVPIPDPKLTTGEMGQSLPTGATLAVTSPATIGTYQIGGRERTVAVAANGTSLGAASASDRSWAGLHTVYTHGDGVTAQYASGSDAGAPADLGSYERRDYFGPTEYDYAVVGHPSGKPAVERDYSASGQAGVTTYTGDGGVRLSSGLRRFLYTVRFGSTGFLFSDRVSNASQILYNRTPLERVAKVAPWLTLDSNPYPVVYDGKLVWVVDGYTTSADYPGSQRASYSTMTGTVDDSGSLGGDQVNYMRDAVKAVVDAYDGSVTLYAWDQTDPILQTWEKVFPNVVQGKDMIPADLLPHLQYPTDLFAAQRYQLARYHVTDPVQFLQGNGWWSVPPDPHNPGHQQPAYRTPIALPTADDPTGADSAPVMSLTSQMLSFGTQGLAGLMTATDDGTIRLLTTSGGGPAQVADAFTSDPALSIALSSPDIDTKPSLGTILTVPTSVGLLHVDTAYQVRATTGAAAALEDVLVAYGTRVGYGPTLAAAIDNMLGTPSASDTSKGSGTSASAAALVSQAQQLLAHAAEARSAGHQAEAAAYDRRAERVLSRLAKLLPVSTK